MSEFVNYHKRDVQLPHGCKDLLDVLNLQSPATPPHPGRHCSGKLHDLADHVTRLISSPRPSNGLLIMSKRGAVQLFYRTKEGPLELHLNVPWQKTDSVKGIRAFFFEQGLVAVQDYLSMGSQVLYYELPRVAEPTSRLVVDLFAAVFGLNDETQVYFVFAP